MSVNVDASEVWKKCLSVIKEEINIQSYKTWFEPIKPISLNNNELVIMVPSKFFYEWIESHFLSVLKKAIHSVIGETSVLSYQIAKDDYSDDHLRNENLTTGTSAVRVSARMPSNEPNMFKMTTGNGQNLTPAVESNLNPKYSFDNFIKGDSNQLARAAAFAVSENPGSTSFNPLMIYGGVGLGKTHLIQAIGNRTLSKGKVKNVLYISSEKFTVEFVNAIQHNKASEFSNYYRNIDLLIVDDIQFFAGKEKTQEEFFHIFNTLHQSGKQIVLTSDRPVKDLSGLAERLLSRFQWGLTTDIQPPDLETRIAILNHKAEAEGVVMSPEVIEYIATNVTSNVRHLEGCLIKIIAQSSLTGTDITMPMVRETLRDMIKPTKVNISIDYILRTVCDYFGIAEDMVRGKTRKQEIVQPRQIAMFLSKEFTQSSLKSIGLHFGGRDHTTVIHACEAVKNQSETSEKYRSVLNDIRRKIQMSIS